MRTFLTTVTATVLFLLPASLAHADWTLNIGWHNPPGSTLGVNFLYLGQAWGFEAGIGAVNLAAEGTAAQDDRDNAHLSISGALNVKYFFGSGGVRPYAQVGFGAGIGATVGDDAGAGGGVGGPFAGLGIFGDAGKWYVYAAYNVWQNSGGSPQAGVGFHL